MRKAALLFFVFLTQPAFAAKYDIDQSHTSIEFKVSHLGISSVRGTFSDVKGEFDLDDKNIENSSASAEINVSSIDTRNQKRDDHLKAPDFFDAQKFPKITFKSKKIEKIGDDKLKLTGELTIRDVTKDVVLDVEKGGVAKDPWGNDRAAFSASTMIKRKDYGIVWSKTMDNGSLVVGEDVKITIEVEGIKQK